MHRTMFLVTSVYYHETGPTNNIGGVVVVVVAAALAAKLAFYKHKYYVTLNTTGTVLHSI